jgi:predicted glycosyltransferase
VKPRLVFHCQHSLGLGHLVRSLALAGALAEFADVTLLNGGRLPTGTVLPAGVDLVDLPSLGHDDAHRLVSHEAERSVEQVQEERRRVVLEVFRRVRPDVVVVELYPFGRRKFEFELVPLLDAAAASTPRPLIVSSVRDILVGRRDQVRHDERVVELANRYLDAVLVHSDPTFARFEESFRPATPLTVPVHHTGFVVPPRPPAGRERLHPLRRILVSVGGGMVGEELLAVAADAAPDLFGRTGLTTTLVAGPFLPPSARQRLRARSDASVTVVDRVDDVCAEIRHSVASVSQAGYNTSMDVLLADRPAVVVPFEAPGEDEQTKRAVRMDRLGLVRMIPPQELSAGRLVADVVGTITAPRPATRLDLAGRERSAELIADLVGEHRSRAR